MNAGKITGCALGAIQNRHAVAEAGEPPRWAWLFNTPIAPTPIARVLAELEAYLSLLRAGPKAGADAALTKQQARVAIAIERWSWEWGTEA